MTNDELEKIRARADAATAGPWEPYNETGSKFPGIDGATGSVVVFGYDGEDAGVRGKDDAERQANAAFIARARTDIPALLDEAARLRALAVFDDGTPEGLPYKTLWDEAIKMGAEDVREVMARATRAEAEVERLQHDVDRARGAQGELLAHAERLGAAISWLDKPFVDADTSEAEIRKRIEFMLADYRQALSAYRVEMKTVL